MQKRRAKEAPRPDTAGLSREDLLKLYRLIYASRRTDDKEIVLKRQNKAYFQINGAGHEAICAAAGLAARSGYDWFYTYYRDRALALAVGVTPYEMLLQAVGSIDDPASAGRQMPAHWGHRDYRLVSASSPIATQYLQAVGCAEAIRKARDHEDVRSALGGRFFADEVVICTGGDGSTSEGEFWEALTTACVMELPLVFVIEDNEYAISVPREVQTPRSSISKAVAGFQPLLIVEVDGCDPVASYRVMSDAVAHARAGKGPALVHAHCIRPYSHSMSDDQRLYRPPSEIDEEAARDPIVTFPRRLVEEGVAGEEELEAIRRDVDKEIEESAERALAAKWPEKTRAAAEMWVFSPDVDPTSAAFATEPAFEGEPRTMIDLINQTLSDEMARDARVVVFGEDVADATREAALPEVKGKGGVFKATHGLQRAHGGHRCYNSPLAEANILGRTVGLATRGLKPVAEIQFIDYIWPAYEQIRNEWSVLRWRSGNTFSCGSVVRTTIGGYIRGALCHSQSGEVLFTHIPGIRVVYPSNALDACGLLRTAIRCDDPVLYLEHKHLYRQTYNRSAYPGKEFMIPFGKAARVREGSHVTIVTYGALVERSLRAAKQLSEEGIEAEVLDLRTIQPYDWDAIAESVAKTSRAVVAYEDNRAWGYGAEIAARIGDELFRELDAPVKRVAALDTFVAYNPDLEDVILPQVEDLASAARDLVRY
ncbi:MAG TPA: dehydrogenase E1 component subunit alpha/beta [Planctomycetota bacterium]|nr:dehydrogenase E1 component subunit alpha/beta [Planctomycetota bacterium]